MIHWVFAIAALLAATAATFMRDVRTAILSLWVAGLSVGAIYLTIGAEVLAIIQWIIATLVAITFVFFAVMFGEYSRTAGKKKPSERRQGILPFAAILIGVGFVGLIWIGSRTGFDNAMTIPAEGNDLASVGKRIIEDHFLSIELLAIMLFIVLVGGGVIARPEKRGSRDLSGEVES